MSPPHDSANKTPLIGRQSELSICPKEALGKDYDWPTDLKSEAYTSNSSLPKEGELRHKPSLSSVSTADFFPNNPLEHSTKNVRSREISESGLLAPPVTPARSSLSPVTRHVDRRSSEAPASPAPNTFRVSSWNAACDPIPDRTENNMSPKAHFSGPRSGKNEDNKATCSRKVLETIPSIRAVASGDSVGSKPRGFSDQYCEGYYAGLHRLPLAKEEYGDVLEGYIAGLQRFVDLQVPSYIDQHRTVENVSGDAKNDLKVDDTRPTPMVGLKENSGSSPTTQDKHEVGQANTRYSSAQFGAPLTRQLSGNQIQSLERNEATDKSQSATAMTPSRVTSVGRGVTSPGGSLGENRSWNISLPVNRRYQPASFNWMQGLPQHDGASDPAKLDMPEAETGNEARIRAPNEPISQELEKAPTPPPKNDDSPTKCSHWHAKSPKSSPSKPNRSPTKSRLDRLASHLGVKRSDSATDQDDGRPGSPEVTATTTPDRKKRREELKRFLSRPKGEQIHELKAVETERNHDA